MAVWLRTHRVEILIFLGAFFVRALYAFVIQLKAGSHGFIAYSDAEYFYYTAAKNLLEHHVFSVAQSAPYYPDAFHTPLYPMLVAALLWLKIPLFGIVIVQDLVAAATVVLAYRIAYILSNSNRIALVAAIFAALEPMSIYWSGLLMTDVFFAFLMTVSFYFLMREKTLGSAIVLGLATLTRPIGLYFAPIFALFVCYQYLKKNKDGKIIIQNVALFLVAFAVVISPWYVRNKISFDTWSLTSAGWYDVYYYPVSVFAQERGIPLQTKVIDINSDQEFTRFSFKHSAYFKSEALSVIRANTPAYFIFQIMRSLSSLFTDRYEYLLKVIIKSELPGLYMRTPSAIWSFMLASGQVFWLLLYMLSCIAFVFPALRHWWLFFVMLVGMNALLSGGINPGGTDMSRYSLPFYTFFPTFAGMGFMYLWSGFSNFFRNSFSTKQ